MFIWESENLQTQVSWDGRSVWVTLATGETIARFSDNGIDIHTTVEEQLEGRGQCLCCTHSRTTVEDWDRFCNFLRDRQGIVLPGECRPTRFC